MGTIRGPAIFLAQFMRDEAPYDSIENIGRWVASLGYKAVQLPGWDPRAIDLDQAAESKTYCDEYKGKLKEMGLDITELTGYLAGPRIVLTSNYKRAAARCPGVQGEKARPVVRGTLFVNPDPFRTRPRCVPWCVPDDINLIAWALPATRWRRPDGTR